MLAFEDDKPIGVCVKHYSNSPIQVFIKRDFRRKGYGTRLVNAMKNKLGNLEGAYGIVGSEIFYKNLGMDV